MRLIIIVAVSLMIVLWLNACREPTYLEQQASTCRVSGGEPITIMQHTTNNAPANSIYCEKAAAR